MIGFFVPLVRLLQGIFGGWKDPEFRALGYFVLMLLLTGTIFYVEVERWSILDALYFSVTTLTTVGFGDLSPQTEIGKIFTIIYILIGVGSVFSFIFLLAEHAKRQDPLHRKLVGQEEDKKE